MNVTAKDAKIAWFSTDEYDRLLRVVEAGYEQALGTAAPYLHCLSRVDAFLTRLAQDMTFEAPYASGHMMHAVWMSLNEALRAPVRQHLLTEMIRRGVVRYHAGQVLTGARGAEASVYPGYFRYYITSARELSTRERRRIYSELRALYADVVHLLETMDDRVLMDRIRERFRLPGWSLERVWRGNRRVAGATQLYEDARDSFRREQEEDGLTHRGERVVADVTAPLHPWLRRHHHVYRSQHRTQYNFLVEAPVVLLLRRGGERRAVTVPFSVVDLTVQTHEVHLRATSTPGAKRVYTLDTSHSVRVHSLSPYGWYLRERALGHAARAGSFFAFWWAETRDLASLDTACEVARDRVDPAFYEALRLTADALIASHMLAHAPREVTFVSPDTVQDTFY